MQNLFKVVGENEFQADSALEAAQEYYDTICDGGGLQFTVYEYNPQGNTLLRKFSVDLSEEDNEVVEIKDDMKAVYGSMIKKAAFLNKFGYKIAMDEFESDSPSAEQVLNSPLAQVIKNTCKNCKTEEEAKQLIRDFVANFTSIVR